MKKRVLQYSAVFDPIPKGGYNVSFPDFPGCVTFGGTFEDARAKAREALELWLEEMAAAGEKIPVFDGRPIVDEVKVSLPARMKTVHASHHR